MSILYAAKRYYEIGDGTEPTADENHQHLKEELMRQIPLQRAVKQFTELAISNKVSIYGKSIVLIGRALIQFSPIDLKVPVAFLIQESDTEYGMTWIVDPLLDHNKMKKFSGSNEAGSNSDFAGQTCDAFAHFTLADSMEFVAVDIQG